jgi:uncharacterized membrane protein
MRKRFYIVDSWRGLAVLGMVFYHAWHLSEIMIFGYQFPDSLFIEMVGHLTRWSFLMVVGVSLYFSFQKEEAFSKKFLSKQFKRTLQIALAAMAVSVATYFYAPDMWIFFGILHSIVACRLLMIPFVKIPKIAFLLALSIVFLTPTVQSLSSDLPIFLPLGVQWDHSWRAIDYFPLFPYLSAVAFGIFLGERMTKVQDSPFWKRILFDRNWPLEYIGKHALSLYLLHVPVLIVVYTLITSVT